MNTLLQPHRHVRQGFTLLELVAAGALLALLMSSFVVTLHAAHGAQTLALRQQAALLVLDNAVERLAAASVTPAAASLETLVRAEFGRSELAALPDVALQCERRGAQVSVCIMQRNGRLLASVAVPVVAGAAPSGKTEAPRP